jgi:DOPA 4,5-dioxygenase
MDTHMSERGRRIVGSKDWRSAEIIESYHAHVYYDGATKNVAGELRREIGRHFNVVVGRWHDTLVGPHPVSFYQVAFSKELFAPFVQWLSVNRCGLSILIHPNTGDAYEDHTDNMMWLGDSLPLNAHLLR